MKLLQDLEQLKLLLLSVGGEHNVPISLEMVKGADKSYKLYKEQFKQEQMKKQRKKQTKRRKKRKLEEIKTEEKRLNERLQRLKDEEKAVRYGIGKGNELH